MIVALGSRSVKSIGSKKKTWMVRMICGEASLQVNPHHFGWNHHQQMTIRPRSQYLQHHLRQRSSSGGQRSIQQQQRRRQLPSLTGRKHNPKNYQYRSNYPDCYDDTNQSTLLRSYFPPLLFWTPHLLSCVTCVRGAHYNV